MENKIENNRIIRQLEIRIFKYGLIIAFCFRCLRSVVEFINDSPIEVKMIGFANIILIVFLYYHHRRWPKIAKLIFFLQILLTSILTWEIAGGWQGAVPYLMIVVMLAIVMITHGPVQYVCILAYGAVLVFQAITSPVEKLTITNSDYATILLQLILLVNIVVLVIITLYVKGRFNNYKEYIELTSRRLIHSTETISGQNQQLEEQQIELDSIRNNLQSLVAIKVSEAQAKSDMLKEYAFVNAHHVRGPLARILGLIILLEKEGIDPSSSSLIRDIKSRALEMDVIVKEINAITT